MPSLADQRIKLLCKRFTGIEARNDYAEVYTGIIHK
jgi:hypothetical protein